MYGRSQRRTAVLSFLSLPLLSLVFGSDALLSLALGQQAAPATRRQDQQANPEASNETANGSANSSNAGKANVSAAMRSLLVAIEFDAAHQFNEYAIERITDPQVREYALANSEIMSQFAKEFEQIAASHDSSSPAGSSGSQASADGRDVDLSETVADIGEEVQDRLRRRAQRIDDRARANGAAQGRAAQNDPVAGRLRANNQRRSSATRGRASREADAEQGPNRNRTRVLLPALRERLPELLELVGEAVEDDEQTGNPGWVRYESRLADAELDGMQRELNGYHGDAFDQAYLGMALMENVHLRAALDVSQQDANAQLEKKTTMNAMQELKDRSQQARRLMEKLQIGDRGDLESAAGERHSTPSSRSPGGRQQ